MVVMLPAMSQFRSHHSVRSLLQIYVKTARFTFSFDSVASKSYVFDIKCVSLSYGVLKLWI